MKMKFICPETLHFPSDGHFVFKKEIDDNF